MKENVIDNEDFIQVAEEDEYFYVSFLLVEKLDLFNIRYLSDIFYKYNVLAKKDWVIDLSTITYIDSSTIGFFVKQGHVLQKDLKCLKLIGVGETIRRIFKTDGFEKFIKVYSNKLFQ